MSDEKKQKTILVIDDEADTVTYMETLLQDNGYNTISANNGHQGMKKAKENIPDLIVVDVSMPEQSGMGFYREMKKDSKLTNIPIVFVTGVTGFGGDDQAIKKFLEGRRNVPAPEGYFSKPIDRDIFLKKVKELLS